MRILLRSAALGLCSILVAALSSAPAAEPPGAAVSASATTPFLRTLGTAQDGGFPHAACACDRCSRARREPGFRRYIASLALVLPTDGRTFLFDATPDLRPQLRALEDVTHPPTDRVDRQPLEGVFLTHAHIGHYLGLAFFGYEAIHTRPLDVTHAETGTAVEVGKLDGQQKRLPAVVVPFPFYDPEKTRVRA